MAARRRLVAGNWKMNGLREQLGEVAAVDAGLEGITAEVAICPPATLVAAVVGAAAGSAIRVGGQDCHAKASGAHTGDVAAEMLADAGAQYVIVGHSERRADHGESDAAVCTKAEAAWRARLTAILCVGETADERKAGQALTVVSGQLAGSIPDAATAGNLVVAYEPVWAIGTGLTPTTDDIQQMHAHIRAELVRRFGPEAEAIRVLYGGSVKPDNAAAIFALGDVDGALVGGASLKATDFLAIIQAAG